MNKKIVFDDNGDNVNVKNKNIQKKPNNNLNYKNRTNKNFKEFGKWFEKYAEYNTGDVDDIKDSELQTLLNLCKSSFESILPFEKKKNPSDANWLGVALHKGTAKDRTNAGALLIQSNPLANLPALQTLISFCRSSNKFNSDVMKILTDTFIEILLPPNRKLISLEMRGSDWKALSKNNVSENLKKEIFAYWYFENELKDHYFEFLKNVQQILQSGQENSKGVAILNATKLLIYSPEKEQMLLTMLINKLGDPSNKVASNALYHLTELVYKHSNMCGVIVDETEKLLFRNNISESAQHFALNFLSQIAPRGYPEVCSKLVNICFSFFKILVQKGAINNKTMQAILRCLNKSIIEAKPTTNDGQIMSKEMQDTIYRLVHLADIKISIQTLSLLLQLITIKNENSDRFYNALYNKLLDLNLTLIGNNTASQFLHIVHKSIHFDQNILRAQAFIKRLLQLSLYMPPQITCGILIIINKLLGSRPELRIANMVENVKVSVLDDEILKKFGNNDEDEEFYRDVPSDCEVNENSIEKEKESEIENDKKKTTSWVHKKVFENKNDVKTSQIYPTKYDPYHRVPAYAGAEFSNRFELLLLQRHYHPTIKIFAQNILNDKKIDYYGDPLKDFGLSHFLERFSFKNPKKLKDESENNATHNKNYLPQGTRSQPVNSLTKENCTEDELYIYKFLEKKRENETKYIKSESSKENEETESVDDNEFDEYLDSLCKKTIHKVEKEKININYMKELSDDIYKIKNKEKFKKKKKETEDDSDYEESDAIESDLDGIDQDDSDIEMEMLNEDSYESDFSNNDENESEDEEPKQKKFKKVNFSKTLKNQDDVSSLFAAAEDFSELLEETGNMKGHGTSSAIFNKDKSSEKQLKWEEKRRFKLSDKKFKKKKNKN